MNPWLTLTLWLLALWFWILYGGDISKWIVRRFLMSSIERFVCWRHGIPYKDFLDWKAEEQK